MIQPKPQPERIRNPRAARSATSARIVRNSRARYNTIVRTSVLLGIVLVTLMGYVMLTSNLPGLSYAASKAEHDREALAEEDARLDDRIAALSSDDRLATLASRLGMHEPRPQQFALVKLPAPQTPADTHLRFPVFTSLAGFFLPAATRSR